MLRWLLQGDTLVIMDMFAHERVRDVLVETRSKHRACAVRNDSRPATVKTSDSRIRRIRLLLLVRAECVPSVLLELSHQLHLAVKYHKGEELYT